MEKKISIFTGGRGNKNLISFLTKYSHYEIRLLINGFDDGLSTGRIRQIIPNMLGPSDFRKNISYVGKNKSLISFLDYRLPQKYYAYNFDDALSCVQNNIETFYKKIGYSYESNNIKEVAHNINTVIKYIKIFNNYEKELLSFRFDYGDCAIGNIVFAGIYLENYDFQKTINIYASLCDVPSNIKIINIDEGIGLKLVGLLSNGDLLINESDIVNKDYKNKGDLSNFWLIPVDYNINKYNNLNYAEKFALLNSISIKPNCSNLVKQELLSSNLIIYGSGTQFSSLLPSYFIVNDFIAKKLKNKIKINIANLIFDNDIHNLYIEDILDKMLFLFKDQNNLFNSISYCFIDNESIQNNTKFCLRHSDADFYKNIKLIKDNFTDHKTSGHNGEILFNKIKEIIDDKLQN